MWRRLPFGLLSILAGCGGHVAGSPSPPVTVNDGIPLGALPRQALGKGECGLFLWMTGAAPRLVLMAKSGPPPFARLLLDGRLTDLPRIAGGDLAGGANALYGDGRITASLDLTLEARKGLTDGAVVRAGSIRIDRTDGDGFVVPVSGLLACG